jgi:hypothetical protein
MKDIIFEFKYLIVILLLGLLITPILYLITKFNKKITVKDKYIRYRKKS